MWSKATGRRLRRTSIIGIGCAAFLAGVGLSVLGWSVPIGAGLGSIALVVLCWRRKLLIAVPAAVVVGLLLGLWRGGDVQVQLRHYGPWYDQKVSMTGTVVQDSTYGSKGQRDFRLEHVRIEGKELPGQVRVTTFSGVEPRQGDVINATGKLRTGFGNYQAGMYYATAQVVGRGESPFAQMRRWFSAAILNVIPEPQASLGLGFLLGIKSQLPNTLEDQLKIVGLTHIVVASGYNLTILVRVARRLLVNRSKYQATLAAVMLMVGFVGVTGFSPSMTRAALVTSLALAAWYYGRVIHPVVLLLFSAAVTAMVNPMYVWGDIGWYLSFLAFAGVMLGAPLLQKRLFKRREAPQLAQIVLETICAELATLPLVLFVFGSTSVVGLLANTIVTPLVPLAMLATFVAGAASVVLPGFGAWLALPAHWLLGYMVAAVQWLATIPWARASVSLDAVGMIAAYCGLLVVGWLIYKRTRYNYLSKSVVD